MTWVVTVHDGGGSMVEAADPNFAAGFDDEKVAEQFCDVLNNALSMNPDTRQDWWAIYYEVPDAKRLKIPTATAQQIAEFTQGQGLPPGKQAYDLQVLVAMLVEGLPVEVLPPPVVPPTPEEEQSALDSITRALTPRDP